MQHEQFQRNPWHAYLEREAVDLDDDGAVNSPCHLKLHGMSKESAQGRIDQLSDCKKTFSNEEELGQDDLRGSSLV